MNGETRQTILDGGFTVEETADEIRISRLVALDDDAERNGDRLLAWLMQIVRAGAIGSPRMREGFAITVNPDDGPDDRAHLRLTLTTRA